MLHFVRRTRRGRHVRFGLLVRVRDSELGDRVRIGSGSQVDHSTIGAYSYVGNNSSILYVRIGRFCSIAWQASIIGHGAHPMDRLSTHPFPYNPEFGFVEHDGTDVERRDTVVGNDCWIGAGAVVLPGVRVGDGCAVGAGSIVTKDIPDFSIAVGNPARVIGQRFDEPTRELLRATRWWDLPEDRLRDHLPLFQGAVGDRAALHAGLRALAR